MNNLLKLICDTYDEIVIPIEGVTAIFRRDIWWHTKCCDFDFINGQIELTKFPSEGQLRPDTILHIALTSRSK